MMMWIILTVVVVFLIGVGLPLIRDLRYEQRLRARKMEEAQESEDEPRS